MKLRRFNIHQIFSFLDYHKYNVFPLSQRKAIRNSYNYARTQLVNTIISHKVL